jgi:hypothetical protein
MDFVIPRIWAEEIRAFLSCLTNERQIAGSTCSQALCVLPFLYREALQIDIWGTPFISTAKAAQELF